MATEPDGARESLAPLLDKVVEHVPAPQVETGPFRMLVTTIERNPFLGRMLPVRLFVGSLKAGEAIHELTRACQVVYKGRVSMVLAFRGRYCNHIKEANPD